MEMPIRIMITLFVALAVGSTIIVFAKQMIEDSRENLKEIDPGNSEDIDDEEKIISVTSIDNSQIIDLMQECYRRHHQQTFERELCFAVISRDANPSWDWASIESHFQNRSDFRAVADISNDVGDGDYAMNVVFDPVGPDERIILTK